MTQDITRECPRDAILNAAGRLLGVYGYQKTTVDDIAHEAHMGKGTVYVYFHSKEEIAISWIDRVNEEIRGALTTIAESQAPPADRLKKMLEVRVMLRFDSAVGCTKSMDELLASLRYILLEWRERWHEMEARIFANVLAEGRLTNAFEFDDVQSTARSLLVATNSLLPYSLSARQLGERDEVIREVDRIGDLLLSGLRTRS